MNSALHIELITETYAPEINGVALTVQSLHDGLIGLGHQVSLVRPERPGEVRRSCPALMLVDGAPLPRYPGLRFGLPAGRRLTSRWQAQRPDAVYIATEGPLGWSALRAANALGIPVATGFHTRFDDYVGRYGAGFLAPWVLAWLRRFHNRGDATLVPTRELNHQLSALGFKHVKTLARAVDTIRFQPALRQAELRDQWGVGASGLAVIHVGRLAAEKNLPLLMRSFRAIQEERPDARLIVVGDGPERDALQEANPDVVFTGTLRGEALSIAFASADLFVFPSTSETFGNVTLEAMASGVATVAYDYGAAREHLRHGLHGAAVTVGDEALFVAECRRIARHPERALMGAKARNAVASLSPRQVAIDFADLLASLAEPLRKVA